MRPERRFSSERSVMWAREYRHPGGGRGARPGARGGGGAGARVLRGVDDFLSRRRLELVDEAADHAEAAGPEGGIGGVEAERRQQLAVAQRAAGLEHREVALGEAGTGALVD